MLGFHRQKSNARGRSISTKISVSLLAALIPSLIILILASCLMAASSISKLNDNVLKAQTDYAVSIVDGFFDNKVTAASMYEEDSRLQNYFESVKTPEKISSYSETPAVVQDLAAILRRMSGQNVQQTWVASQETDTFLLSTGETGSAGFGAGITWDDDVMQKKSTVITDPYEDPITGKQVISIVAPVFSKDGSSVIGFMGMDVYLDNLAESLSAIKVGKQGYLELLSSTSDYIYSEDPTAIGQNVSALDIGADYKSKVQNKYEGSIDFSYAGIAYTSISRISSTTGWLAIATIPLAEINATRNGLVLVLALLSIVILVVLVMIVLGIVRKTMRPLSEISSNVEAFAGGDLGVDIKVNTDDEIGSLANSVRLAISTLKEIIGDVSSVLREISNGNLDVTVRGNYVGDFQPMREALQNIITSLNNTLGQINMAADQVSGGSDQVSSGSQALSQGATEQASSVQQLAATIGEISSQISENAENATQANERMDSVSKEVDESNHRMQDMLGAMNEIKESSGEIGKIIKAIEDIAFQTNILALNAAVEAARAGAAGKGFAVVADEVRSLANKSQEASQNTSVLIENSLRAVENGTSIADQTARSLTAVVSGVSDVSGTINRISTASVEQAQSIAQVTQGVDQISAVVQTNSATAEQSAAASEELSSQAQMLKRLVGQFRLNAQQNSQGLLGGAAFEGLPR